MDMSTSFSTEPIRFSNVAKKIEPNAPFDLAPIYVTGQIEIGVTYEKEMPLCAGLQEEYGVVIPKRIQFCANCDKTITIIAEYDKGAMIQIIIGLEKLQQELAKEGDEDVEVESFLTDDVKVILTEEFTDLHQTVVGVYASITMLLNHIILFWLKTE